jgi:TetR/AcrR family transcriptional repressor of nem operon
MRYVKGHKDASRRRILDAASRLFRRDGIHAVGVNALMTEAGLTNGAFYAHFASKDELARKAVVDAMAKTRMRWKRSIEGQSDGLAALVQTYLSVWHRDNPGRGCSVAAAAAELVRHPLETREAVAAEFDEAVALMAEHLPQDDGEERRMRATTILGLMIGALQLARLIPDRERSDRILSTAAETALAMARAAS